MEINESPQYELKPPGIELLLFLLLLITILLSGLLYMALDYGGKFFSTTLPFIILLSLWLLLYFPYKLYLHFTRSIDTVIFNGKGIHIQNKKIDLIEFHPWFDITDLFVNKEDFDKKPEEVSFITTYTARTINLQLYDTIFTSTEKIWFKINEIYNFYCKVRD